MNNFMASDIANSPIVKVNKENNNLEPIPQHPTNIDMGLNSFEEEIVIKCINDKHNEAIAAIKKTYRNDQEGFKILMDEIVGYILLWYSLQKDKNNDEKIKQVSINLDNRLVMIMTQRLLVLEEQKDKDIADIIHREISGLRKTRRLANRKIG